MQNSTPNSIGQILRNLRKSHKIPLAVLAKDTGVSEATLSRIENGHTEASAALLYRLATLLNVEISSFFSDNSTPLKGRARSVMRKGDGAKFTSERLSALVLSAELAQKHMHPFINVTSARTLRETGGLNAHDGEEFLFVLKGTLILHSQTHAPLKLEQGDSVYFSASQPHAYVSGGDDPAQYLVITSARMPDMDPVTKDTQ
jgi:transcriptional regulator with XRE-family HTH domain